MTYLGAIAQSKPSSPLYYAISIPLPAGFWMTQTPVTTQLTILATTYSKTLPI